MSKVLLYSTTACPYCIRAKRLLEQKGVVYQEIKVDHNSQQMAIMIQRSNRRTVPQIFIDDYHVGGYDDLAELDVEGNLDILLSKVST